MNAFTRVKILKVQISNPESGEIKSRLFARKIMGKVLLGKGYLRTTNTIDTLCRNYVHTTTIEGPDPEHPLDANVAHST